MVVLRNTLANRIQMLGCACLFLMSSGCGNDPESLLEDKWEEVRWSYEKADRPKVDLLTAVGFGSEAFEQRAIQLHEAEYWWFRPNRAFVIGLPEGAQRKGQWRLKGRGHILTLDYDDGSVEVYDVKELNERRMVLNLDLGMEVRGIARLDFFREVAAADVSAGLTGFGPRTLRDEGTALSKTVSR